MGIVVSLNINILISLHKIGSYLIYMSTHLQKVLVIVSILVHGC